MIDDFMVFLKKLNDCFASCNKKAHSIQRFSVEKSSEMNQSAGGDLYSWKLVTLYNLQEKFWAAIKKQYHPKSSSL